MTKQAQATACCDDYRRWSRRSFLKGAATIGAAALTAPAWLPKVTMAQTRNGRDTLVCVFLRGAMDALSTVVPYGDPAYYNARPTMALNPPGQTDGVIDLNGFFGLTPVLSPLMPAYQNGDLAIVHACGSPDPSRSHFEAMSIMEFATPNMDMHVSEGWLAKHLLATPPARQGALLRAASMGKFIPESLQGAPGALPIEDPANFELQGARQTRTLYDSYLREMYENTVEPMQSIALNTLDTVSLLGAVSWSQYAPRVPYPTAEVGQAFQHAAALIKADLGVEAISIDHGNWDTHANQGNLSGTMAGLLADVGGSLAAFYQDMQGYLDRVTVVVMSEFGRRVEENGSAGTDHGHGSCMFLMGGNVNGGQVHGTWPGLSAQYLFEGRDLAVTTDYRDILAEILQKRMGNPDVNQAFPNYRPTVGNLVN